MGLLESALMLGEGAGERALLVAEQFGFEEVARDRPAIDRDEGLAGALAGRVNGAGDDFLAAAGRADEQDRGIARRDLANQPAKRGDRRRLADDQALRRGAPGLQPGRTAGLAPWTGVFATFQFHPPGQMNFVSKPCVNGNG